MLTYFAGEADQAERDSRSIFIGNVDFATSVEEVPPTLDPLRVSYVVLLCPIQRLATAGIGGLDVVLGNVYPYLVT